MSSDSLNGVLGQAARFASDYLIRGSLLPNNNTIQSAEYTFNNTLGKLRLVGTIDSNLVMAAANTLTVRLQYKDSNGAWQNDVTMLISGAATRPAGELFSFIPPPSDTKRVYRMEITTNFNAATTRLTAAVELLPRV